MQGFKKQEACRSTRVSSPGRLERTVSGKEKRRSGINPAREYYTMPHPYSAHSFRHGLEPPVPRRLNPLEILFRLEQEAFELRILDEGCRVVRLRERSEKPKRD